MKWLEEFKIAIIEENEKQIKELIDKMPPFEKLEHMQEAFSLISEAILVINSKKEKIQKDMNQLKKAKSFLDSQYSKSFYEILS